MSTSRPVVAVSACLLFGESVLLVERGRAPFAGLLSLPGGRVEFGERIADAVRREVVEETGLLVRELVFHSLHEAIGEETHAVIAVHGARLDATAAPAAGDDAAAVGFHALAALPELEAAGRTTPDLARIVRSVADSLPIASGF